jgi:hypothetical protein
MRINSLQLECNNSEQTLNFYHKVLGIPFAGTEGKKLSFQLAASILTFVPATSPDRRYHIALTIPHNQVHSALTWLQSRAEVIPISQHHFVADFRNWNAEAIYFYDNNGNIMELIGRRDLDNASLDTFGPYSFLSISEAGIVTQNVKGTCNALRQRYTLDYFSRQPALEHFAAIGDDEGLFIVVSENRNWYPTNISSTIHPLTIGFTAHGIDHNFSWPIQ